MKLFIRNAIVTKSGVHKTEQILYIYEECKPLSQNKTKSLRYLIIAEQIAYKCQLNLTQNDQIPDCFESSGHKTT